MKVTTLLAGSSVNVPSPGIDTVLEPAQVPADTRQTDRPTPELNPAEPVMAVKLVELPGSTDLVSPRAAMAGGLVVIVYEEVAACPRASAARYLIV